ncbi:MAG: GNAT family N-acetyltransferase [Chloroflexi bacterium]|nr:GNAT family N-acetyltransferase [Chloroflexota bacterium]
MPVEQLTPEHEFWPALVEHLLRVDMARWVIDTNAHPLPAAYFLGAFAGAEIIGHISIRTQIVTVPKTDWSAGYNHRLTDAFSKPLTETFVQTFAVEEAYRRQGYGRALQLAALQLTRTLGAYQLRSWSSLDKSENYMLKISLGFAAYPAIFVTEDGKQISGVYFVQVV